MVEINRSEDRPQVCWLEAKEVVGRLNRSLVGWANYFCLGPVSKAIRRLTHTRTATAASVVVQKHKCGAGDHALPRRVLPRALGLVTPGRLRSAFRGRKHDACPRAGCGKSACPVR